jgi:hypothetical protein
MASRALPLALVGIAGLAAFALAAGGKPAAAPAPAPASSPSAGLPQPILQRILDALASKDPNKMRAEATKLEAEGYTLQAGDLRRAADLAAVAQGWGMLSGDAPAPRRAPKTPQPYSPLPGIMEAVVADADLDPKRLQAQALVLELMKKPRGQEDRELVADFQRRNGLKDSGNYTPATGACLALRYGLVPPAPYFPERGRVKSKANYRGVLLGIAARDPQRAEEFRKAAEQV